MTSLSTYLCARAASVTAKSASLTLAITISIAGSTQPIGPSENKDVSSKPLASLNLAGEIPDGVGRQLRARAVTIQPGGHTASHTHVNRPTLEYVLQGNVIEIRHGIEVPHATGEMVPAGNGVSHYWVNRGTLPVVLVPIDVYTP